MNCASINVGRTAGTSAGFDAVLGLVIATLPEWSALFVCEADGFQDNRPAHTSHHACYRHYPGAGSWAMLFVIRARFQQFIRSVTRRSRCGAIHLSQRASDSNKAVNLYLVGVHGAHGDLLMDTFADLAVLVRKRPFGSKLVMVGDWNVDLLET